MPGGSKKNEEKDAVNQLAVAEGTARTYLMQCGNRVVEHEDTNAFMAEVLYTLFNRKSSAEVPFSARAAEEIRKMDSEVVIIFITNMAQYAIRGYAVDALDYVLKPVSYFAFSQRLNRAIERMKKREAKVIMVNIKGGMVRINIANIYYIESQGHTLILHTILGDYETTGKMKEMDEKLSGMNFCRGNKGYLINLQHVDRIQDNCAVVKGEELNGKDIIAVPLEGEGGMHIGYITHRNISLSRLGEIYVEALKRCVLP